MEINIVDRQGDPQKIALLVSKVEFITIAKALTDYCEIVKDHIAKKVGVANINDIQKVDLSFEDSAFLTAGMIIEKAVNVMLDAEKVISPLQYEEVKTFVKQNLMEG